MDFEWRGSFGPAGPGQSEAEMLTFNLTWPILDIWSRTMGFGRPDNDYDGPL